MESQLRREKSLKLREQELISQAKQLEMKERELNSLETDLRLRELEISSRERQLKLEYCQQQMAELDKRMTELETFFQIPKDCSTGNHSLQIIPLTFSLGTKKTRLFIKTPNNSFQPIGDL